MRGDIRYAHRHVVVWDRDVVMTIPVEAYMTRRKWGVGRFGGTKWHTWL